MSKKVGPAEVLTQLDPLRALVLVSVGTDVHPFPRLLDWVKQWLDTLAAQQVQVVVQYGTTTAPAATKNCLPVELLPLPTLLELMHRATVVVVQGGPGGILDARSCGALPIVVARHHELGEHVDNHQVAFTNRLARDGYIQLAESQQQFNQMLESGLSQPQSLQLPVAAAAPIPQAATRIEAEVAALLARKPPRRRTG